MDCQVDDEPVTAEMQAEDRTFRVDIVPEGGCGTVPCGFSICAPSENNAYSLATIALKRLDAAIDLSDLTLVEIHPALPVSP